MRGHFLFADCSLAEIFDHRGQEVFSGGIFFQAPGEE